MQLQGAGLSQRFIPAHLWYLDEDDSGSGPGVASLQRSSFGVVRPEAEAASPAMTQTPNPSAATPFYSVG